MNPAVLHIPTRVRSAQGATNSVISARHSHESRELAFGIGTIAILLLLQARWDAPVVLRDGGDANAMALLVQTGDMLHRTLGIALGVSGLIWCRSYTRDSLHWRQPLGWILLAWTLWLASSVWWSEDPALTGRRLILLAFLLISAASFSRLSTVTAFALVSIGALGSLITGVVCELFWGTFQPLQSGYRFAGTGHPNLQGTTLAVGAIAAVGLVLSSGKYRRMAATGAGLCLTGLWLTNSRTSIVSLTACAAFGGGLVLMRNAARQRKLLQVAGMTFCVIVSAATMIIAFQGFRSTLAAGITEQRDEGRLGDFTGRVDLWKTCIPYASAHPVLGYGYDSFWSANHISDISSELQWAINEGHSMYLDLWLNQGAPGALLFLTALAICLINSVGSFWRGNDSGAIWAMLLFFPLIHGATESIMVPITNYPAYVVVAAIFVQLRRGYDMRSRSVARTPY